jgi:hypothetical protein
MTSTGCGLIYDLLYINVVQGRKESRGYPRVTDMHVSDYGLYSREKG